MKRRHCFWVLIPAFSSAFGCSSSDAPPPSKVTRQGSDGRFTFTLEADALTEGRNTLWIELHDADGAAITDAQVALTFSMTEMEHGDFQGRAFHETGGTYQADVEFSMPGDWTVDVVAHRHATGESDQTTFEVFVE